MNVLRNQWSVSGTDSSGDAAEQVNSRLILLDIIVK